MNYQSALKYLNEISKGGSRLGLDRLEKLLKILGNPEENQKYIHVAGTNGKGSTSVILASILQAAGYKTGLFTSPYLVEVNEQIRVNGQYISNEDFAKYCKILNDATSKLAPSDLPTEFELLTALAFLYFKDKACDLVILETGCGGTLDATNVIGDTLVSVITNIGMDHTQILGHTLTEIAKCKAGIIRENSEVVSYAQEKEAGDVIKEVCDQLHTKLTVADFSKIICHGEHLSMQKFSYKEYKEISLPLIGEHQRKNSAVALETVTRLNAMGYKITMDAVKQGMFQVSWPARFEILFKKPLVILDGGHNSQCVKEVTRVFDNYIPNKKVIFVMGVLADKDYEKMVDLLLPYAKIFYTVTPDNKRALSADLLCKLLQTKGCEAIASKTVEEGVVSALNKAGSEDIVCILGSLYMAGQVRKCFY